jgi:hypothetical protein
LLRIAKERFIALAEEITKIFPTECSEIYYSPHSKSSRVSGKLLDHHKYMREELQNDGILEKPDIQKKHDLSWWQGLGEDDVSGTVTTNYEQNFLIISGCYKFFLYSIFPHNQFSAVNYPVIYFPTMKFLKKSTTNKPG